MEQCVSFRMAHEVEVERPAADAYRLINSVEKWPDIFPPCEKAAVIERDGSRYTIEISAHVGESVRTWRSHREMHPDSFRVDFQQADPFPPLVSMTGFWQAVANGPQKCLIRLVHDFATNDEVASRADPPMTATQAEAWIRKICDSNSEKELAAFKDACETGKV